MKTYNKNGFEYFYDNHIRLWVIYPIDTNGFRIEHNPQGRILESDYFHNKKQLEEFLLVNINNDNFTKL